MKNEERDLIVTSRLVYGEKLSSIAAKVGISENTVCRAVKAFELVKAHDMETLIKEARNGHVKKGDAVWAAGKLGVELPKELLDAFTERSRYIYKMRERVTPKADQQSETEENEETTLEAIRQAVAATQVLVMTELKIQTSSIRNINLLLTQMWASRGEEK